jgi:hypothetical protein
MIRSNLLFSIAALIVLLASPLSAQLAADDASNAAYDDGLQTGDNGGNDLTSWTLALTGTTGSPPFTDTLVAPASTVGGTDSAMNSGGRAWILRSQDNGAIPSFPTVFATRPFNPLPLGGKLSLKMEHEEAFQAANVIIETAAGDDLFTLRGISGNWQLIDGDGGTSVGNDVPLQINVTHDSATTYSIDVYDLTGVQSPISLTRPYATPGAPAQFNFNAQSSFTDRYLIINNIRIDPAGTTIPVELSDFKLE